MPTHEGISRRRALKLAGISTAGVLGASVPVIAADTCDCPDGGVQSEQNSDTAGWWGTGYEQHQSRQSCSLHYYGSVLNPSGTKWIHEFRLVGHSWARYHGVTGDDDWEADENIEYQQFNVVNNNPADTIYNAENPSTDERGAFPQPSGGSGTQHEYNETVKTILEIAVSEVYDPIAYTLDAYAIATAIHNDLSHLFDNNDVSECSTCVSHTWEYSEGYMDPYPSEASNHFHFYVHSDNAWSIDISAGQEMGGPQSQSGPANTGVQFTQSLSDSVPVNVSCDSDVSTMSVPPLDRGLTRRELHRRYPSNRIRKSALERGSPLHQFAEDEDYLDWFALPGKFTTIDDI